MSADLITEDVVAHLARRFGKARQSVKARIITFGSALTCSINYSKLLHGNKFFFGLPAAFLDPSQTFADARLGEFCLLICGSLDNILVLPRSFVVDMMRGVPSRRLDVFVDGKAYILQTTKHPKCDVTQYLNAFPSPDAPQPVELENKSDVTQGPDRIHLKVQFALITLGRAEGCAVWVPVSDRNLSYQRVSFSSRTVGKLPNFGFDENTRRIVHNIDVLWLRRNVIQKAFEIEASTAIYSGLLRLNDLVLAQPNSQIDLYIAAASARRGKVYNQLLRPSFQHLLPNCAFVTFEHIAEQMRRVEAFPVDTGARVSGLVRGEKFCVPEHFLYPDQL